MAECNCIEVHDIYPNLNDQQQFRLNKISKVRDYLIADIKERELMSKRLSKYIAFLNYFDKSLTLIRLGFLKVVFPLGGGGSI